MAEGGFNDSCVHIDRRLEGDGAYRGILKSCYRAVTEVSYIEEEARLVRYLQLGLRYGFGLDEPTLIAASGDLGGRGGQAASWTRNTLHVRMGYRVSRSQLDVPNAFAEGVRYLQSRALQDSAWMVTKQITISHRRCTLFKR